MVENNNSSSNQVAKKEGELQNKSSKTEDVRIQNIKAAVAISDVMKTSLGPKGMDKLIESSRGEIIVTNDGATILKNLSVLHPTAKLLIQTSKA
jgi:T-complex protein 1 subunit delta